MKIAVEKRIDALTAEERTLLLERRPDNEARLQESVRAILLRVRQSGDAALFEMARDYDRVELSALEIPRERWEEARAGLDPAVQEGLERAARNIRTFHEAQIPPEVVVEIEPGVRLGRRSVPLAAVGVYAPGGRAAYPSSVLMGVVPACAAGVGDVIVCSPPGASGEPPAEVLAACAIGGATRLFALGGAGAIGALAYGTASVPKVDAIVGPGNQWVTEAKRQVAGELRIDSPAGPSEVLVLAGPGANATRVAMELLAQAEHDPEAAVCAVSWDEGVITTVRSELTRLLEEAPRREIAAEAIASRGALLVARDRREALSFSEEYAAEHLAIFTDDPRGDMESQTRAGTIFLGEESSVAFGDYMTGANHVLPTSGRSSSFSGLSTLEFLRFFTWQELTPAGAAGMAESVRVLAEAERLPAHAAAAAERADRADRAERAGVPVATSSDAKGGGR